MVVTTTHHHVTLQQPVIVTGIKVKANPPFLKVASGGQGKGPAGKAKGTTQQKKKKWGKPSTSKPVNSTGPSTSPKYKTKDKPKITVAMIQNLAEELQAIEQESLNDGHDSEVTQESDLEQEDSEITLTEDKEQ